MDLPSLVLKPKRDRSVHRRHPWLFSGAIAHVDDEATDGALIDVVSAGGEWLARGYLNRCSQITVRLLSWIQGQAIDKAFWRHRLEQAKIGRVPLQDEPATTAYRLVNAESDGVPGLIVDRYGDWLVLQSLTLGVDRFRTQLVELLVDLIEGIRGVYERSDVAVREKEGLPPRSGPLWGEEPPESVEVLENGFRFLVDIKHGHKTGFYLDQRESRARLPAYCDGAEVLNGFSYSGAFGVYALAGGAAVVANVDTSARALDLAKSNIALNGFETAKVAYREEDVFAQLRADRAAGRQYDVIVLDPPRFASSRSQVKRACRGYKDINWIAFQILRRGGLLFTFSCSSLVSSELFQKVVFGAAVDAGRDVQIIGYLSQASDHPIAVSFPEAQYLKGLICRCW
jgi:23S rRNA (cytosine1962-C5)-methyltransferase